MSTNTLTARYAAAQSGGSYVIEGKQSKIHKIGNINPSRRGMNGDVYCEDGLSPTLTTNKGEGIKIIQRGHGFNKGGVHHIAPTLTSSSYHENNFVYDLHNARKKDMVGTLTASGHSDSTSIGTFGITSGQRIRKLTPKECWRLQGFPDWAFERAKAVNSDSQLYKQAGNSVTVPLVAAIAKHF